MNIAIIPARGGSKRITKKNITEFLGLPIIAYPILAAINSGIFEKIIVSTDDDEISEVAQKYGAIVPFKRPKELADDFTGIIEVIAHSVGWLENNGYKPKHICCIFATAPLIMKNDLKQGLEKLIAGNWEYVFTAASYSYPIKRSLYINDEDSVKMLFPQHSKTRSQELEKNYHDAGQFYWGKTGAWKKKQNVLNANASCIILPNWRTCDIDNNEDLEMAKVLFSNLNKKYKNEFLYLNKIKESKLRIKRTKPHSMLFGRSQEISGNVMIDVFNNLFYYLIKLLSSYKKYPKKTKKAKSNFKILFVYRDWGKDITLNAEIIRSLKEYCGKNNVIFLELLRYDNVIQSINDVINNNNISHLLLDTRILTVDTGIFKTIKIMFNCYTLSKLLGANNVVCLCGITDYLHAGYRFQAELLTSHNGLAIMWGGTSFDDVRSFRHKRIIGQLIQPVSCETINELESNEFEHLPSYDVAIIGLNYEPRRSLTKKLINVLNDKSISYYYNTKKDLEYITYLGIYKKSKIGFNTNWVVGEKNKYHFVGRNIEVLVSGSLLLTQKVHVLDLYFQEGKDYIAFNNYDDLIDKIKYFLNNEEERLEIAKSGQNSIFELFNDSYTWNEINKSLNIFHYPVLPTSEPNNNTVR